MPYFSQVRRVCLFLATARSGHSILAHLLTAHPRVLISDELDAVGLLQEGYSREQLFALIRFQDSRYQRRDRRKSGYSYKIEGTWQNEREKHPQVIGDAKGARSVEALGAARGEPVEALRRTLGLPLRVIVHLRNPFDVLSTKRRRDGRDLARLVRSFARNHEKLVRAWERLGVEEKLLQRHEDLSADPAGHFVRMFRFLGVEPLPAVVAACAKKIWRKPHRSRRQVSWPKAQIARLEAMLAASPLFHCYRYRS